ncbi:MAG: trimethylamine methyltransferase family protein, partial [Armatimonadetes bacterium]|nr:trimethylamine methyltransferase family protein [Armatimonadota bacterium]
MSFLTSAQIEQMHHVSLDLLESVGVKIDHPEIVARLEAAGAEADSEGLSVRIPRRLVQKSIQQAPRNVRLADRRGGCIEVGADGGTVFWSGNALCFVRGKEKKEIESSDLAEFARVLDALDNVHAVVGTSIADYPSVVRDFVGFRILAENSTKHLRPVIFSPDGPRAILEMAEVLNDGVSLSERPIVSFGYSITSPFHWGRSPMDLFLATSGYGLPMMVNAEPLAGGTAPVTLAGLLTQANAEALSGIVILQTLEPGRPCIFNLGFSHMLDMRSALATSGQIQDGMIAAAGAEIARWHGLPSASWLSSDNFLCDEQSVLEKATTGVLHALGGVNIVWGMGQLETEVSLSSEQAVIDNELAGLVLRAQRGIEVTPETIAEDVIRACAERGDFLSHDHTLTHFREEHLESTLLSPQRRDAWVAAGAPTLGERAAHRVEEILSAPAEPCLSPDQATRLQD